MRSFSDEDQRLSPFSRRNIVGYRPPDATGLPFSMSSPNRRPIHTMHHPENAAGMPKMSLLRNLNHQDPEPDLPFKLEDFLGSSGFGSERLSLRSPHGSFNPFSSNVDNFLENFTKRADTETVYKTLEEAQHQQSLFTLLSEGILADKRKRALDQRNVPQLKQESSEQYFEFQHPHNTASQDGRVSNNLSMTMDVPSIKGNVFKTAEDEEEFLYGNADNLGHGPQPPSVMDATAQEETKPRSAELEKIHDLLKTIGLEIGDAEISKLSVRTRERLYGKGLPSSSRERRSSGSQKPESLKTRTRSDTRSPESNHKCSQSPALSLRASNDRLSYPNSEFSTKDKDEGQGPPSPTPKQEQRSPALGQEQLSPALGQEQPSPAFGQEAIITMPAQPPTYNYAALPTPLMVNPTPPVHYQMTNYSPYNSTHMLQGSVNITSPSTPLFPTSPSSALFPPSPSTPLFPPSFVPNTNIPPPLFFPQSQMTGYSQYGSAQVPPNFGVPPPQIPFVFNAYGNSTAPNWSPGFSGLIMPSLPNRSNLKVIKTIVGTNLNVAKSTELKKQDSCHLVYIETTDTSTKTTLAPDKNQVASPDDKNRVAQKVKVLRDLSKLKSDRIAREKKLAFLQRKLESLNNQHGEILKNKSQQNDFHTNPLLAQAKRIENELVALCKEATKSDEQQSSLEKVAKILGLNISEKGNPPVESPIVSTEDQPEVGSSTANSSTPIEVKAQTQVGNATSS